MAQTGKYATYEYIKILQGIHKHVRHIENTSVAYRRKLLKGAEAWWMYKGSVPVGSVAILMEVNLKDLILIIDEQIKERGANLR